MGNIAEKIIAFNSNLRLQMKLPDGIRAMNPFIENPEAMRASSAFYRKYYSDHEPRQLILGINPGRFGAGVTGVPFTDTKRLNDICGIAIQNPSTHEPSSVFIYQLIESLGGPEKFYRQFYINSVCPLGFVKINKNKREINYNYYDHAELRHLIIPFAIDSIQQHIQAGNCKTDKAFCLGTGKNYSFLKDLNQRARFFERIIPLEHPRFIMQYRSGQMQEYIDKFKKVLSED